ncbi:MULTISPECIES: hypothetical protein [Pantoea]|jgi:hypothetical protein|uniref:hypothetical protein n=1 Tax=Pantoea TaxID=53335 RepID=UPI0011C46B98|nr:MULTISPECIES: hypothetical protein [Pantoea]MBZ6388823.1 hypothetical protein [Pantoea piersonii]MBZ6402230.1 hypothetical protein [Pantoea piersonii]MBZ6409972.1 hypothetical protein [Pantoea piersonii]MBZ6427296.1 hypothetical protein [Pantoea piersonii]NYB01503.1 hypothetical protein [Pantoea piersonii]
MTLSTPRNFSLILYKKVEIQSWQLYLEAGRHITYCPLGQLLQGISYLRLSSYEKWSACCQVE